MRPYTEQVIKSGKTEQREHETNQKQDQNVTEKFINYITTSVPVVKQLYRRTHSHYSTHFSSVLIQFSSVTMSMFISCEVH